MHSDLLFFAGWSDSNFVHFALALPSHDLDDNNCTLLKLNVYSTLLLVLLAFVEQFQLIFFSDVYLVELIDLLLFVETGNRCFLLTNNNYRVT